MPVWYVRSAPSTSMTSVQRWLDLVSCLEGPFFILFLRSPFRLLLPLLPLCPRPAYTGSSN